MTHPKRLAPAAIALVWASSVLIAPTVSAEGSPPLSDAENATLAERKPPSEAEEAFIAYLQDLDQRHRDAGGIPADRLLAEEGETVALLYCRALGIDGPCAPTTEGGRTRYLATGSTPAAARRRWWAWMEGNTSEIGVIPETANCSPYGLVAFYMDDENSQNNNGRSGWIGATVSTNDTRWRFCKLDFAATNQFAPMDPQAPYFTGAYAVQNFGMVCPVSARRVYRYQDSEDTNNNNAFAGNIFPNIVTNNGVWMMSCHYDSPPAMWTLMTDFPALPLHYGVFSDHAGVTLLGAGRHPIGKVYQDDEDNFNLNLWIWSPGATMQGGNNTERRLMKAQ